jgi:hypothetical protein
MALKKAESKKQTVGEKKEKTRHVAEDERWRKRKRRVAIQNLEIIWSINTRTDR